MRKILCVICLLLTVGCESTAENKVVPGIVPNTVKEKKVIQKVMPSNVIGAVERIYFPPMKSAFLSRIDTGATTSSLDAQNIKIFERDGESWIAFTIVNRDTNETYRFEKPQVKRVRIKRIGEEEHRKTVEMDVRMGAETFKEDFTVAERKDFDYQVLIGRNILSGRAIVDVSIENTLK